MRILENMEACTGCTACKNVCSKHAINMKPDRYGFVHPEIDKTLCVECGACKTVCPVQNSPAVSDSTRVWAAISHDEPERMNSTSGGVFSLLAEEIIGEGGIVFGAAYDQEKKVVHTAIEHREELARLQGAKYAQSALEDTFEQVRSALRAGRKVLFSGTPCQVAGLKNFVGTDDSNLLTVDLICHGVPSPKAWKAYLGYRQEQDVQAEIAAEVNLRSKVSGWTGAGYSVQFRYPSGFEYCQKFDDDLYMQAFTNDMLMRPSCLACAFKGIERCSDVTLGDYWGVEDFCPEFNDDKGTSLVLIHTQKGQQYWDNLSAKCRRQEIVDQQYVSRNPSLVRSAWSYQDRETLLRRISAKNFGKIEKELIRLKRGKPSMYKRIVWKIRRIIKRITRH